MKDKTVKTLSKQDKISLHLSKMVDQAISGISATSNTSPLNPEDKIGLDEDKAEDNTDRGADDHSENIPDGDREENGDVEYETYDNLK
jgi:hypothetical protein